MRRTINILTDDYGGLYTIDEKRLMKCPNVKKYRIAEGCKEVDENAFEGCDKLEVLYLPWTMSDEVAEKVFDFLPENVGNIVHCDRPYVDEVLDVNDAWYDEERTQTDTFGVMYANEGRRLIVATMPDSIGKYYEVPDGVLTICDFAFANCSNHYLVLSVPRSIKAIGDNIFGREGGRIEIRN